MMTLEEASLSYNQDMESSTGFQWSDIPYYMASTVVDTLVTTADSLTFGLFDDDDIEGNKTSQILHWMNEDLGSFYEEHKEGVELGSFLGGLVLPGMAVSKALKWAKTGPTILSSKLNTASKWEIKAYDTLVDQGKYAAEWKEAVSKVKWHTIGQGVAEGALYELAFLHFNNQHAYLEEDYSPMDFAIGTGLGALVGPLRWMGKKKELYTNSTRLAAEVDKLDEVTNVLYPSITKGNRIAYQAYQYGDIQQNAAKLSQSADGKAYTEKSLNSTILNISKEIESMGTERFNGTNIKVADRVGDRHNYRLGEYEDVYKATPQDHIIKMSLKNPEAFAGVEKIDLFDITNKSKAARDKVAGLKGNAYYADSGGSASSIFFIPRGKDIKAKTLEQLDAIKDSLGIEVQATNLDTTIIFKKGAGTAQRQWAADYLLQADRKNLPVQIRGDTRGIKPNWRRADELANIKLAAIDKLGHFAPYQKWLDVLADVSSESVIMHPYVDGNMLGYIEAKAATTMAQDPRLVRTFNHDATIKSKIRYSALKQNTAETDKFWLESAQAVRNQVQTDRGLRTAYNLGEDEYGVGKLQEIINSFEADIDTFPKVIRIGNEDIRSLEQAQEYLWDWKQTEVKSLFDIGAHDLQIAIKTNLDVQTIEAMKLSGFSLPLQVEQLSKYKKGFVLNDIISNKSIELTGLGINGAQKAEMNAAILLDRKAASNFHNSVVENTLTKLQTRGTEVDDLWKYVVGGDDAKMVTQNIEALLTNLESRNTIIQSTDHLLRIFGPVADPIVNMGKKLQNVYNNLNTRFLTELSPSLVALRQNKVAAQQWAQIAQRLESLGSKESKRLNIVEDGGDIKIGFGKKEDGTEEFLKYKNSDQDIVLLKENQDFWQAWLPVRRELKSFNDAILTIQGKPTQQGNPLWLPNFNPTDSFVGFVIHKDKPSDRWMIAANTADELESEIARLRKEIGGDYDIRTRTNTDMGEWNILHRHAELNDLSPANTFAMKKGIEKMELPGDVALDRFVNNLRSTTISKVKTLTRLSLPDIFNPLEQATEIATEAARAGGKHLGHKIQKPTSHSDIIYRTLLDQSMVAETPALDWANNIVTVAINSAIGKTNKLLREFTDKDGVTDFEELTKAMRAQNVLPSWTTFDEFKRAQNLRYDRNVAQHEIAKKQSALVTMNLRFAEAAHAMVTTLSAPVLIATEARHLQTGKGAFKVTRNLMDSIKFMYSKDPEAIEAMAQGVKHGYTKSVVAEATEALADLGRLDNGAWNKKFKGLVKLMSTPSDWSEEITRRAAFASGYLIAKEKFPTATMDMLVTHAGAFVTRTMGNYTARQKPAMFQGAFGQLVGLYQTFMLTVGQNLYRYAEAGDKAAIATMLAGHSAMFGMEALPLYQEFNQALGVYASDEHNDISTTTYKIFGNVEDQSRSMAEFLLFGIPSTAFGSGLFTRASIEPRTPISLSTPAGLGFLPASVDSTIKALDVGFRTIGDTYRSVAAGGGIKDMFTAAMQGVAAQQLWRPGARYAEQFILGKSYDNKGEVIDEDLWDEPWAVAARIFGTRPLEEQVLRELRYRTSYYNKVDRDRQQKIIKDVRRVVTNGEDMDQLGTLMQQYLKKGSYKGWNEIVKTSYLSLGTNYAQRLEDYAQKQPAIMDIAATYGN